MHPGHCAGGYVPPSTNQITIVDCRNECANLNSSIGFFAYRKIVLNDGRDCACYLEDGNCPDDDQHNNYDAYRILQGLICVNRTC